MPAAPDRTALVRDRPVAGRVIHCAPYGNLHAGSFIPTLAGAARAAHERGYETTLCLPELARGRVWLDEVSGLADVRFLRSQGTRAALPQLVKLVHEAAEHATILHTHFGAFDDAAALLGLWRRRTAVVWHVHSARERRIRLRSKAYATVFGRMVDAILCVSPEIEATCVEQRFPRSKLRMLANAVDLERFTPIDAAERAAARRELDLSPSAHVVLHFGWDWHRKGGDLLLGAADLIGSESDITFLTVLAENPDASLGVELEANPTVHQLPPHANVNELYAAADVFLNCSRAEGLPYALLEALARGLPAVATDLPVQRELLTGLPAARVVPPEAPAIAAAIRELVASTPRQRADHAMLARARVANSYSLETWSRQLVDVYDSLLGPS
jgi:glycosyltransferase involved in cell wall biosynthesis